MLDDEEWHAQYSKTSCLCYLREAFCLNLVVIKYSRKDDADAVHLRLDENHCLCVVVGKSGGSVIMEEGTCKKILGRR
jgi:hypothetical protein